jgi:hypothetical protein
VKIKTVDDGCEKFSSSLPFVDPKPIYLWCYGLARTTQIRSDYKH